MRIAGISSLVLAVALIAAGAQAQVPKGLEPLSADQRNMAANNDISSHKLEEAMSALNAKNFVVAEGLFQDYLKTNPTHADANFMLGVTKMSLNKWTEAKEYLEVAVRKNPKSPDPKSRLGVTLIKLGDLEGAKKQRDELVKMQKACKGECKQAQWIDGGIAMIDATTPPKP